MKRPMRLVAFALLPFVVASCAGKPVTAPRVVVPETVPHEVKVAGTAARQFGDMLALGVGVSNGSTKEYVITADRVFAVDKDGNRIAPLSVTEAARQAGGSTALVAGLRGAGGGALLAGLMGAIPGAIIGATRGAQGAGTGAAVGAGIGVAVGAIGGFYESKTKTEREIISQLGELYLGAKVSKPGLPVSGFVFFPAAEYSGVRVIAIEQPGGAIAEIAGPMVPKPAASRGLDLAQRGR